MDFPIIPEFWWSTDILSPSCFLQGVDKEIFPCEQGKIGSFKTFLTTIENLAVNISKNNKKLDITVSRQN